MPEPTLYLFDGSNLFHAGGFGDRDALIDLLASMVAGHGARGVVVFDGVGDGRQVGPLEVRYAADADPVLERLAAESRETDRVELITSDTTIRLTSGQEVRKRSSERFLAELASPKSRDHVPSRLADRLDPDTRRRLEALRRGRPGA
jgi:predicted RNA-binding protein with PIN domain